MLIVELNDLSFSLATLEPNGMANVFCAGPDALYHIDGMLEAIVGDHNLQFSIANATFYPQRRRFFRIDADVTLKYWPLEGEEMAPREPEHKKVNLSACGLRFETTRFLRHVEKVGIEMQLGGRSGELVRCLGRVVRAKFREDQSCEDVAIDFVEIKPEEQEKLIRFCLFEQRRQLRLKVRVLDEFVG